MEPLDAADEHWHCKTVVEDMVHRAQGKGMYVQCTHCGRPTRVSRSFGALSVYDTLDWIDVLVRERLAAGEAAVRRLPVIKVYSTVAVNQLLAAVEGMNNWHVSQLVQSVRASYARLRW